VRSALEAYPNIEVVGEAGEGEAGVLNALKLQPTAIVMDMNMPKNGRHQEILFCRHHIRKS
jgi:DNA-binding NarL/FixJ family response regulator